MPIIDWGNPYPENSVTISLEANPSTGYTWVYEMKPEGVAAVVDEYFVQDSSPIPVVGAPWIYNCVIAPVSDGKTVMTFYYMRLWEGKESAAKVIKYTIIVSNKTIELSVPVNG